MGDHAQKVIQLISDKEAKHRKVQDKFYEQLDQINLMIYRCVSRQTARHKVVTVNTCVQTIETSAQSQPRRPKAMHFQAIKQELLPPANMIQKSKSDGLHVLVEAINVVEGIKGPPKRITELNLMQRMHMIQDRNEDSDASSDYSSCSATQSPPARQPIEPNVVSKAMYTEVESGFACNLCNKVLARAYDIHRHIKCVHSEYRPYSCDVCGRKFKLSFQLKEHSIIHNAEKAHRCHFCAKRFRRKRDIKKHCVRRHSQQWRQLLVQVKPDNQQQKINQSSTSLRIPESATKISIRGVSV